MPASPHLHLPSSIRAGLALAILLPGPLLASGFAVQDQSAGSIALGHAGAASADSAAVALQNPAMATGFDRSSTSVNLGGISLSADFQNAGSLNAIGLPVAMPATAAADGAAPLLSLFHTRRLSERLHFTFSMHTPFGLATDYDPDWVGRYQLTTAELATLALNPSLAWKVSDTISLAAGLRAVHAKSKLASAVDFGTLCLVAIDPTSCAGAQIGPGSHDGHATIEADDWGYGFNLALAVRASDRTRWGLTWRSKVDLDLDGDAQFDNPTLPGPFAGLTMTPLTTDGDARSDITLPESLTASLYHDLSGSTALVADYTHTRWSRLHALVVSFANGAPDKVVPFNWKDTHKLAVGLMHELDDRWQLRGGLEWESSAVDDAERNPVVPDSRRLFAGIGARFRLASGGSVDFGLGRLRFARGGIDYTLPGAGTLRGRYALDSWHVGIQYNRGFN
ncbi:MAG: outer membrane protein transport protein [Xanthomonadales bacterium]|nr:outer membrane protein transport protein [Xanthomonadales bacterium]